MHYDNPPSRAVCGSRKPGQWPAWWLPNTRSPSPVELRCWKADNWAVTDPMISFCPLFCTNYGWLPWHWSMNVASDWIPELRPFDLKSNVLLSLYKRKAFTNDWSGYVLINDSESCLFVYGYWERCSKVPSICFFYSNLANWWSRYLYTSQDRIPLDCAVHPLSISSSSGRYFKGGSVVLQGVEVTDNATFPMFSDTLRWFSDWWFVEKT